MPTNEELGGIRPDSTVRPTRPALSDPNQVTTLRNTYYVNVIWP